MMKQPYATFCHHRAILTALYLCGTSSLGGVQQVLQEPNVWPDHENVLHYGAVADGATDLSGPFQTAINTLSARPEGGVVYIPSGTYVLEHPVQLMPRVSIIASPAAHIRAGTDLPYMLDTPTGDTHLRLRDQYIIGGRWDGAARADRAFRLRDFQALWIQNVTLLDFQSAYIDIDGSEASATCYELMLNQVMIKRTVAAGPRPAGNVGIRAGRHRAGLSDSHFSDVVISGVERGLSGGFFICKFHGIHVWSYGPTQGRLHTAFYMQGRNNHFVQCQIDNPMEHGWFIDEDGTFISNSCITYGDGGDWVKDDQAVCVHINGPYTTVVNHNRWNMKSHERPMAAEFSGNLSRLRTAANTINTQDGSIRHVHGDTGPGALEAAVTLSWNGSDEPKIQQAHNVTTVDAANTALSIRFQRPMQNERYGVLIDLVTEADHVSGTWRILEKTRHGLRVEFPDFRGRPTEAILNMQFIGSH